MLAICYWLLAIGQDVTPPPITAREIRRWEPAVKLPDTVDEKRIYGEYADLFGKLRLFRTGRYGIVDQDISHGWVLGTARGTWELKGRQIILSPLKESGDLIGQRRTLDVVECQEQFLLVAFEDRAGFVRNGPFEPGSCYMRGRH